MYSRETAAFWNKLKKEVILCLQIRQAVAGNETEDKAAFQHNRTATRKGDMRGRKRYEEVTQ